MNTYLVQRNWLMGKRISEEELKGEGRAEYGLQVIKRLAKELMALYGKGFTKTNLYSFYSFYRAYPEIFQTLSGKSTGYLSWSHYVALIQVKDSVARQQHIKTEKEDYFIDLVFYNYILKCFVLIDLKTSKVRHQDVGQMDMYIRMYDELKRGEGDNPTLGILLCADTDEDIARYSVMHGNEQLFASKYKLYLPTEEELRAEIESQKAIFALQQEDGE